MTMKKTVRVPVAADGVPIVESSQHLDKTRELPVCQAAAANAMDEASPRQVLDDEVTVPVQSSIESTLTFEVLRRQSTESDNQDDHVANAAANDGVDAEVDSGEKTEHRKSRELLVTPQAALLRVLISGESDGAQIIHKVREWTDGQIRLDDGTLATAISELERRGLVEHRSGPVDKRSGQPRTTFVLTAAGKTSALQVLAASLTRKV